MSEVMDNDEIFARLTPGTMTLLNMGGVVTEFTVVSNGDGKVRLRRTDGKPIIPEELGLDANLFGDADE